MNESYSGIRDQLRKSSRNRPVPPGSSDDGQRPGLVPVALDAPTQTFEVVGRQDTAEHNGAVPLEVFSFVHRVPHSTLEPGRQHRTLGRVEGHSLAGCGFARR
jgi:hypothetical protein